VCKHAWQLADLEPHGLQIVNAALQLAQVKGLVGASDNGAAPLAVIPIDPDVFERWSDMGRTEIGEVDAPSRSRTLTSFKACAGRFAIMFLSVHLVAAVFMPEHLCMCRANGGARGNTAKQASRIQSQTDNIADLKACDFGGLQK
jgi:hypothetical protein